MDFISVCSGIEAATVAWEPLGWKPLFYSEVDKFPRSVLAHHYPQTPNLGDMTKYSEWGDCNADVLVGGTPCQSFSVAGLRKGLADPRGNLMLTYLAIANRYRPSWLVWENVPGVLSSNGGRDFGTFLGALGQLGYGFAYRILDAQFIGVPQRRRRVFVVGSLRGWASAAAVLFERHSLSGDSPPSREARQKVTGLTARCFGGNNTGGEVSVATACTAHAGRYDFESELFVVGEQQKVAKTLLGKPNDSIAEDLETYVTCAGTLTATYGEQSGQDMFGDGMLQVVHGTLNPCVSEHAFTLGRNNGQENAIIFTQNTRDEVREMVVVGALASNPGAKQQAYLRQGMQVRRLLPVECERLQGFPDNYTRIPWGKKSAEECPDGHRYKAIGNSMAVPVMRWIGKRIEAVDNILAPNSEERENEGVGMSTKSILMNVDRVLAGKWQGDLK